ncbi:hypothetical protein ABVF61_16125 [Roseibium sp. HPY-6]
MSADPLSVKLFSGQAQREPEPRGHKRRRTIEPMGEHRSRISATLGPG